MRTDKNYLALLYINPLLALIVLSFIAPICATSQSLSLFTVSTNEYPVIEAQFLALDERGEVNYNLLQNDMQVYRDSLECPIIAFRNPSRHMGKYSIVLVFDISGSMNGERMEMTQGAAKSFLDEVQLAFSEIAVLSFNEDVIINADYSSNYDRIVQCIDELSPRGGTSYNNALLTHRYGALDMAARGKYERFVIFLTDGLCSASTDSIVALAQQNQTTVFSLTVDMPMPSSLKYIAQQTGGAYFEGITNKVQAREIYQLIAKKIHATRFGSVKWLATTDCSDNHQGEVSIPYARAEYAYAVPKGAKPVLRPIPDLVFIEKEKAGQRISQPIKLAVENNPVTISGFQFENPPSPTPLLPVVPLILSPDKPYSFDVEYNIPVSGYFSDKLWIKTPDCGQFPIIFSGGSQPAFVITSPKDGDVYSIGTDIPINWKGVSYQKDVELGYRATDSTLCPIGVHAGLSYAWSNVADTGLYIIHGNPNLGFDMMALLTATYGAHSVEEIDLSDDGTRLLTRDEQSYVRIWSIESGELLHGSFQYSSPNLLSESATAMVTFNNGSVQYLDLKTSQAETYEYPERTYITQAFHTSTGKEYYLPLVTITKQRGLTRVWDPRHDRFLSLTMDAPPLDMALSPNGMQALILTDERTLTIYNVARQTYSPAMKIEKGYTRLIVSPNGQTLVAIYPESIALIDLNSMQIIRRFHNSKFIRFGNSSATLLLKNDREMWWLDIPTGKILLQLPQPKHYKLSPNDLHFAFWLNDTMRVQHRDSTKPWYVNESKIWEDYAFTSNSNLLLHIQSGKAYAYHCNTGREAGSLQPDEGSILKLVVIPSTSKIVTLNSNNTFTVWVSKEPQEPSVSGQFKVVDPQPEVMPLLDVGSVFTGNTAEKTFRHFIYNPTAYPVYIDTIQLQPSTTNTFEIISDVSSLLIQPKESRPVEIRFSPIQPQTYSAQLSVTTPRHTYISKIVGKGIQPIVNIQTKRIDMGKLPVGETKDSMAVLLENIHTTESIEIQSIKIIPANNPSFEFSGNLPTVQKLLPGKILSMGFQFHPPFRGLQSASIEILTSDHKLFSIPITGEGLGAHEHIVLGKLIDNESEQFISGTVYYNDLRSMLQMGKQKTHDGRFVFRIEPGRVYTFGAEKIGFIGSSVNLDLTINNLPDTSFIALRMMKTGTGSLLDLHSVFFETDKAELLQESTLELNRVIAELRYQPHVTVEIRGHTDERGTHAYNMQLSEARANAVREYVIWKGIAPERITTKAFGETQPRATGNNEEAFQINRRVEIVFK